MNGTLTRVLAVYPLAIPAVLVLLAGLFPQYLTFDQASGDFLIRGNINAVGAGVAGGYVAILAVFAKWGIKR